ncbi:MAG: hypothetical protein KGL35_25910 [Bradyrhizobium sp.]|nr:hypothetical protein [Bradyrhizobium sp.]HQT76827.1 hypothetical protein [Rhodopila sp.]
MRAIYSIAAALAGGAIVCALTANFPLAALCFLLSWAVSLIAKAAS